MIDFSDFQVLVLGVGGLGCEILKNLVTIGIPTIHIVDLDTIELTNLNRQFLFNECDIGKSKAIVAAKYINQKKFPSLVKDRFVTVIPHYQDLTKFTLEFISAFSIIISGLDAIPPRRFINNQINQLAKLTNFEKCIPFIDGGSEGFKGHCKIIIPGFTACYECSLSTLPTKLKTYPLCTIAHNPRLPEHVIEYVITIEWPKAFNTKNFDLSSSNDLDWIYKNSIKRAIEFNIDTMNISKKFILDVLKNIIPSVSTTNAIIASQCCTELMKLIYDITEIETSNNFTIYNGEDGCFNYSFRYERLKNCQVCSSL